MRILLTGASGQLGAYLLEELRRAGHQVVGWSRSSGIERFEIGIEPVELADPQAVLDALSRADPAVVLHAGAISTAEQARRDPARADLVNVRATGAIAEWCRAHGRRFLFTSTDLVFDGEIPWYREHDPPRPLLVYGKTKAAAEALVLPSSGALVARLSLLYGPSLAGRPSFYDKAIEALRGGRPQVFFDDEFRTPLHYRTAARLLLALAMGSAEGFVHVAGSERVSRHELMNRVARSLGLDVSLVGSNRRAEVPMEEPRPADVSLDTSRLQSLLPVVERPTIEASIEEV